MAAEPRSSTRCARSPTEVQKRKLRPDKIDEKLIHRHLYAPDMPDPDLLVRTSGEYRISNYLLWQLAYSELVFTDVLWPDFRRADLFDAIREYQARERRFGRSTTRNEMKRRRGRTAGTPERNRPSK